MSLPDPAGITLPPAFPRISDFVGHYAELTPDIDAMVLEGQRVTYRQFHDRVEALARALLSAGVKKGDRVATLCTPSPDYFICFLATASIGAIWVGLNPRYQLNELTYVADDSRQCCCSHGRRLRDGIIPRNWKPLRTARPPSGRQSCLMSSLVAFRKVESVSKPSWPMARAFQMPTLHLRASHAAGGMPA